MLSRPLVSVLLPVYRSDRFVRQTLQSIVSQTFKDFELLVYLDGADQATKDAVALFESDRRLRVIDNGVNIGIGATYLKFFDDAVGEFLAQIGHDDIWADRFLEVALQTLKSQPSAPAVFTNVECIDAEGKRLTELKLFCPEKLAVLSQFEQFEELFKGNFLSACSSLVRSSAFTRPITLGPIEQLQDWATWLQAVLVGRLIFVDEILAQYRVHDSNLSLAAAQPRLLTREEKLVRCEIFGAPKFGTLILSGSNPDRDLELILPLLNDRITAEQESQLVERALRVQFQSFGLLASYRLAWASLLWNDGRFRQSLRYEDALELGHFPEYTFFIFGRLIARSKDVHAPLFGRKSIGPFHILRFRFTNNRVRRFQVAISRRPESSELAAERIVQRSISKLGLRSIIINVVKLIRQRGI